MLPTPLPHTPRRPLKAALGCLPPHHPGTSPGTAPEVREAQHIESLRAPMTAPRTAPDARLPEFDEPGLLWMQSQAIPAEAFRQHLHHPARVLLAREDEHESSSGGESHPSALTEPDVKLSPHPAPTLQPRAARRVATGQRAAGPAAQCALTNASTHALDVSAACTSVAPMLRGPR